MPKLRTHNTSVSVDGYMAGPDQSPEHPLGVGGEALHEWIFPSTGDPRGADADFVRRRTQGVGATIMGRNMFGPVRGDWPDDAWKGWWGDDPPFHHPVFVLTRHPRDAVSMAGGTTFHFVTDGIESALEKAYAAADGADVVLGGGASTIDQYLHAELIDEMHLAIVPIVLGGGERLFQRPIPRSYEVVEHVPTEAVTHVVIARR